MPKIQNCFFQQISAFDEQLIKQMQQITLQDYFVLQNNQNILLTLTENFIIITLQSQLQTIIYRCIIDFSIKFQVLYQLLNDQYPLKFPIGIKLQKQHIFSQIMFTTSNHQIIQLWSLQLQKKINQKNFHNFFKAKKKIGKGAFATVYLAQRLRDHKMVAVKAFSKQKQFSRIKGKEALENEIKIMRKLNHQNIVKIQGVYQTQNSIYIVLQYIQGLHLRDFMKNNSLNRSQIKQIIKNILKALIYLSKKNIIHRDLKPQNIMFKSHKTMDLVIGDFGLATYIDAQKYLFVRCGTPGFVAPQIININDIQTKGNSISDVFSVGVIFHYLLFGFSIFESNKSNQLLTQNKKCKFNFSMSLYQSIDEQTLDLLKNMLQKDPLKRISAQDALNHKFFNESMDIQQINLNQYLNPYYFQKKSELTQLKNNYINKQYFQYNQNQNIYF